ncbi:taste receptor type 2 member 7-like [Pleurodeles waltl]|uniref:taste receptor type 2 member 7-like n=1 Tax=Pleurodeles waltl TaxID=8319 RepID=UPI0037099690
MFILSVNFIGWIKRRSDLSSCDLLICSLALSNLCHVGLYFVISINFLLSLKFFSLDTSISWIYGAMLAFRCCSLWFCTWFCLYCYVKIETFTHPLVLRLVTRYLRSMQWLLLASALVSLAICLPSASNYETQPANHNLSDNSVLANRNALHNASLNILGLLLIFSEMNSSYSTHTMFVFLIFLSLGVAILIILCRHMKRMRVNADSFRNPSLKAHRGAVKTITLLLLLYSTYYVLQIVAFSHYSPKTLEILSNFANLYVPVFNSIILIQGISKLWKTLTEMSHPALCCGRERV